MEIKKTKVHMRKGDKIRKNIYIDSTTIGNSNLDRNPRGNEKLNTLKYGDVERGGYTG